MNLSTPPKNSKLISSSQFKPQKQKETRLIEQSALDSIKKRLNFDEV